MEPPSHYYEMDEEEESQSTQSTQVAEATHATHATHATQIEESDDIEADLQYLHLFDNEKQLRLLHREICHIIAHGLIPPDGWYDERFEYINNYSKLDWPGLARRFHNKDEYIYDSAYYVMGLLENLLEDRATKPNFNLNKYHELIYTIVNVWGYYKNMYMDDETDIDVLDLIEGISFL